MGEFYVSLTEDDDYHGRSCYAKKLPPCWKNLKLDRKESEMVQSVGAWRTRTTST